MSIGTRDSRRRRKSRSRCLVIAFGVLAILTAVSAPGGAATGIDISSWQHPGGAPIDWGQVLAAGNTFAMIKATESTSYTNPYFAGDWAGSGGAGLYRSAYHYARPALPLDTALAQARYFVSVTGTMRAPADLPPMLDLEETGGLGPSDLVAWTQTWLSEVQRLTGRTPMLYSGYYFWQSQLGATTSLAGYRLVLPWWTNDPFIVRTPPPWATWTFWQWTSAGSVPGIQGNVDLDRFCCADGNLAALAVPGSAAAGNPFGNVDAIQSQPGGIGVYGWAIDPDSTGPVAVHVYVDYRFAGWTTANNSRSDVASAYPGWGSDHGYAVAVPAGPGIHWVCAYAINVGTGTANMPLGCHWATPTPIGSLEGANAQPDRIRVHGWAIAPDTTAPANVDFYLNGTMMGRVPASGSRPDVGAAYPNYGSNHGYDVTIPGSVGTVCAYGIAAASAQNALLGCQFVLPTPVGFLDGVTAVPSGIRVFGWTIAPDTTAPAEVDFYLNGTMMGRVPASGSRPDVGAAFPAYGSNHGYDVVIPGAHGTVCAFGIANIGPNRLLGCAAI